jgi:hypothetical protein
MWFGDHLVEIEAFFVGFTAAVTDKELVPVTA